MPSTKERIAAVKNTQGKRSDRRKVWKNLRDGIDPRKGIKPSDNVKRQWESRLHTNDPVTYFNLAKHMLGARPIKWMVPSESGDSEGELLSYGNAEDFVASMIHINDERRASIGEDRAQVATVDSGLEIGVACIYRESMIRDGNFEVIIDAIDPKNIYVRFDKYGIYEFVHEYDDDLDSLITQSEQKETWNTSLLQGLRAAGSTAPQTVTVQDYWRREFTVPQGTPVVYNAIMVGEKEIRPETVELSYESIPFDVGFFNGKSFSTEDGERNMSILEPNAKVYTDTSDFLGKLYTHMDEVLTAPIDEFTVGGRPVSDPGDLDPDEGRSVQPYDSARGEQGRRSVNINQVSPVVQYIYSDLQGQTQRGSVSHLLHGNLNFQLSGFAISQIKESSLAAVGEVGVGLEAMWSRTGKWIISEFKASGVKEISFVTPSVASSGKRSFMRRSYTQDDMPEFEDIRATIELATPSDLTERANIAQMLDRSGRPLVGPRTIYENLLYDIVDDVQREMDDVLEKEVSGDRVLQMFMLAAAHDRVADKAERDGDSLKATAVRSQAEVYRQSATEGQQNQQGSPQSMGVEAGGAEMQNPVNGESPQQQAARGL
jgi:hypothetical protein